MGGVGYCCYVSVKIDSTVVRLIEKRKGILIFFHALDTFKLLNEIFLHFYARDSLAVNKVSVSLENVECKE